MKNKYLASILFVALLVVGGCSKFESLNTDPDATSKVTPDLLATNLILSTLKYPGVGKDFLYKDMFAKYISYMEGATDYQYNEIGRTSFSSLVKLTNVAKMTNAAKGSYNESSYVALGHFLRAYTFFNLTLAVGDIPYSEALKGEDGMYNPKYDSQKEVFAGILNELEEAATMFENGSDFDGDPIYHGDPDLWMRATNSLMLKVLTHLNKKTDDPDLKVKERFAKLVSEKKFFRSNNDNFQLVYSSLQVENYPFFKSNFRSYPIMSSTIVDKMKEYGDYRLFYYAEPSSTQIAAGLTMKDWDAYVGVNPSDKFNDISARYSAHEISGINSRYYALDQGEPTFLLSYAEQCFIVAEGILRGWADGDARINYEKGIQAAMSFTAASTPDNATYNHGMKITAPVISAYIESPKVAFGGTTEQKLEKIMQQRYFMGFMQDGWSTYYEYRRTGYPAFPINPQTNLNTDVNRLPSRWMYPDSELSTNRSNLEAAVASQYGGSDDVNQLMWILK